MKTNSCILNGSRRLLTAVVPAFTLCSLVAAQSAFGQDNLVAGPVMPVLTTAPIRNIFVPVGFDDNDTVEIIVHGHFKDSCNKVGPALGTVDDDTKEVAVALRSLKYEGNECIKMQVPFLQSIKLGQVPAGNYTVFAENLADSVAPKTLQVAEATTATADDALYAPVDAVDLSPVVGTKGRYTLTVSGIFPKSEVGCMKMQELKVLPFEDVLVVLPIAAFNSNVAECVKSSSPFERKFKIEKEVELQLKRDTLIHVRVLNGQSLNKVVEVEN